MLELRVTGLECAKSEVYFRLTLNVTTRRSLGVISALFLGLLNVGCSIKPQLFGQQEAGPDLLKFRPSGSVTEWFAYHEGALKPGYPDRREEILQGDPSRGIGLKQAASMGGGEAPIPPPEQFRVFLFMGQSNMAGFAKAGKLDKTMREPHPRIRIWAKGKWQYLSPKRNFGPEVTFAHIMAKNFPTDTIGIIKVAVSGTGMNAWKPDWEWAEANKTGDALKGSLYRDMVNAVAAAREVSDFSLDSFIWKQGGRDGRKPELATSYQDRFVEMVDHLRIDLAVPELPVFVLTYFDEAGIEEHRKILEKVRPNALPLYLSKARVSSYLDNAYPVFHGKLPTKIDQVHFDTRGQVMLGEMTAGAVTEYFNTVEPKQAEDKKGEYIEPPLPK